MLPGKHLEKLAVGARIDVVGRAHRHDLFSVTIHGTKDVIALPARRALDAEAAEAPDHPQKAAENKVRRIEKEDLPLATRRFDESRFQLVAQ